MPATTINLGRVKGSMWYTGTADSNVDIASSLTSAGYTPIKFDIYLNTSSGNIYQYSLLESGLQWILLGNIKGPQGEPGIQGNPGPAGPQGNPGNINIVDLGTFSTTDGNSFNANISDSSFAALSTPGTIAKVSIPDAAELYFLLSKSKLSDTESFYLSATGAQLNNQLTLFTISIYEDKRAVLTPVFVEQNSGDGSSNLVDIGALSSNDGGNTYAGMITSEDYERLSKSGTIIKVRLLAPTQDSDNSDVYFLPSSVIDSDDGSKTYYSMTGGYALSNEIIFIALNIDSNLNVIMVPYRIKNSNVIDLGIMSEDLEFGSGGFITTVSQDLYDSLSKDGAIVHAELPNGYGNFQGSVSHIVASDGAVDVLTATATVILNEQLTVFTMMIDGATLVARLIPTYVSNSESGGDVGIVQDARNLIPDENGAVNPGGRDTVYSVGENSVSIGFSATATKASSTALGPLSHANGENSVAIGNGANTYYEYGVAVGHNASANDRGAIAIGPLAESKGFSLALGASASAEGSSSIALGPYASTSDIDSKTLQLGSGSLSALRCKVELTVTSDERDKADVKNISNALVFLEKLNPVTFVSNDRVNYISDDDKKSEKYRRYGMCDYDRAAHAAGMKKGERRRCGLLAQEVVAAMQEVYGTDNYANIVNDNFHDLAEKPSDVENKYTLAYANLVPFLIGAVKELSQRVKELENQR